MYAWGCGLAFAFCLHRFFFCLELRELTQRKSYSKRWLPEIQWRVSVTPTICYLHLLKKLDLSSKPMMMQRELGKLFLGFLECDQAIISLKTTGSPKSVIFGLDLCHCPGSGREVCPMHKGFSGQQLSPATWEGDQGFQLCGHGPMKHCPILNCNSSVFTKFLSSLLSDHLSTSVRSMWAGKYVSLFSPLFI